VDRCSLHQGLQTNKCNRIKKNEGKAVHNQMTVIAYSSTWTRVLYFWVSHIPQCSTALHISVMKTPPRKITNTSIHNTIYTLYRCSR
jgi:hypothetical protein